LNPLVGPFGIRNGGNTGVIALSPAASRGHVLIERRQKSERIGLGLHAVGRAHGGVQRVVQRAIGG